MARCLNCSGVFFKTLEVRVLPLPKDSADAHRATLLYKKRCKRCKHKYFYRKDFPTGDTCPIPFVLWQAGQRLVGANGPVEPQMIISEYSRRVSRASDKTLAYLGKIRAAERQPAELYAQGLARGGSER